MIYILDDNPKKIAQAIDDNSLDKMIKSIAQVLCEAYRHQYLVYDERLKKVPLPHKYVNKVLILWRNWARECKANYLYLVEFAFCLDDEYTLRFGYEYGKPFKHHKLWNVLLWTKNNVPGLPELYTHKEKSKTYYSLSVSKVSPLPLVVPKKYIFSRFWILESGEHEKCPDLIQSYRTYYEAKLKQRKLKADLWRDEVMSIGVPAGTTYSHSSDLIWTNRQKPEWLEF